MKLNLRFSVTQVQKLRRARCTDFEIYNCGTGCSFGRGSNAVPMHISSSNLLIINTVLFGLPDGYFP